jgi:hypothetical protein
MGVVHVTMARTEDRRAVTLGARSAIGRSRTSTVGIADPRVSAEHASLFWRDGAWHVRDLGSRNGTWLRGDRLAPGSSCTLGVGDTIFVGGSDGPSVELVDAGAPIPRATNVATALVLEATAGLLHVPNEDDPALTVYRGHEEWLADHLDGATIAVSDDDVVTVRGEAWRLQLPPATLDERLATTEGEVPLAIEHCRLHFRVSSDEEYVEMYVAAGARTLEIKSRASHYMLLTLARRRLADAHTVTHREDHGWIYADELARMLGVTKPKLNLDVCRLRQQLAAAGIDGAARIVERRTTTQQLRIGIAALEVTTT